MLDGRQRKIDYLRISLTDRCNLRCLYCMPAGGVQAKAHGEILRYEEILRLVEVGAQMGIKRIRLTGGEPLVRLGIGDFIRSLAKIEGIKDISLTTNGILLAGLARDLKEAGLQRVNISIDTLKPERFSTITRGGDLHKVLAGIEAALEVGLHPVKLNIVAMRGLNDAELVDFARLTEEKPLHVRFIELMPLGEDSRWSKKHWFPLPQIRERLSVLGVLEPVAVEGGGPARNFRLPQGKGSIGFIGALSEHFCHTCNRLRLTADGKLKPCLASDEEIDIKTALRQGADAATIRRIIKSAVAAKPASHHMESGQEDGPRKRVMYQIGG